MDDDGHINHFVLAHTDQTNTQPQNSDKYEKEGQQYWEDADNNDDYDNDINNNEMTFPKIMMIFLAKI